MFRQAIQRPALLDIYRDADGKQIYFAFAVGMGINLASIYIGNPYIISLLMVPVAAVMTFIFLKKPLAWVVLVSVIAANPVNTNASLSLNLIFVLFLPVLDKRCLSKLPSWLYLTLIFAFLSILGSIINWSTTGQFSAQFAAICNYVVGPFFIIPLIYLRLQEKHDSDLLLKGFVFSLIVPSVILLTLARIFGAVGKDINPSVGDYLLDVSVYHLGNVDFRFTRTQLGIQLAALICASFSVIISAVSKNILMITFVCLIITIFLLLVTGSVGSSLAALTGIILISFIVWRYTTFKKFLILFPMFIGLSLAGWSLVPPDIKKYAESRYERRFYEKSLDVSDRIFYWKLSLKFLLSNPEGRGWDLYVSPIDAYPHNDYISYGIAFGFVCGLLYLFVPARILITLVANKVNIKDPLRFTIKLAGVGVVTVLLVNSFADHLTACRWYFNVVWSMIWYGYFAGKSITSQDSAKHKLQGTIL